MRLLAGIRVAVRCIDMVPHGIHLIPYATNWATFRTGAMKTGVKNFVTNTTLGIAMVTEEGKRDCS